MLEPTSGAGCGRYIPRPRRRPLPGNHNRNVRPDAITIHAAGSTGSGMSGTRRGHPQARAGGCRDCKHGPGGVRLRCVYSSERERTTATAAGVDCHRSRQRVRGDAFADVPTRKSAVWNVGKNKPQSIPKPHQPPLLPLSPPRTRRSSGISSASRCRTSSLVLTECPPSQHPPSPRRAPLQHQQQPAHHVDVS
jgi:hypothetical protein